MAQPLESRINAALRSAARLKDVETVISDVETEITAVTVKFDEETARSIDPALTTPQAREARNNAADLEHDVRRLNASLQLLRERRQKIIDDDTHARKLARYEAAKATRDELALHIRTRYPALAMELVEIAQRIAASDAECSTVNADRPKGTPQLESAEYLARECGWSWPSAVGSVPVHRIGDAVVPLLGRPGTYLPLQPGNALAKNSHWSNQITADQEFAKREVPGLTAKTVASKETVDA